MNNKVELLIVFEQNSQDIKSLCLNPLNIVNFMSRNHFELMSDFNKHFKFIKIMSALRNFNKYRGYGVFFKPILEPHH